MKQESIGNDVAQTSEKQIHGYETADVNKALGLLNQLTVQGSSNILYLAEIINILAKPKYSLTPEDVIVE